jgi:3-isopropylmalate/(R)-2-methylmalate dehydratase large subunit
MAVSEIGRKAKMAEEASRPPTLVDNIWKRHQMTDLEGERLLYVDYLLLHEGARHAFDDLELMGRKVHRPRQVIACADHYVPTRERDKGLAGMGDPAVRRMIERLDRNARAHGVQYFGYDDPQQGILHVVAPELGITQPGLLIAGADSHTATHGAFGCLAFGIGASDALHVLATQSLWRRQPKLMRISIDGDLNRHVSAKDVIMAIIARIGVGGAIDHIIEFAGSTVRAMSMEQRMTLCNMAVEAGGQTGVVAPDETTFTYLDGRPSAPKGLQWERALADWRTLPSEDGAIFDAEHVFAAADIAPAVSWGTSPEQASSIDGAVPDPRTVADPGKRLEVAAALEYMGLTPGMPLTSIAVDRVFIGSCTNARIEDLRAAAAIARNGRAVVPTWVVPGSSAVKRQAEAEGLDRIFIAAGFEWHDAGCSLCTALNGDMLAELERCASTSNRNFRGRQGRNGRTHLLSPAMAAAAAITGRLTDVRKLEV